MTVRTVEGTSIWHKDYVFATVINDNAAELIKTQKRVAAHRTDTLKGVENIIEALDLLADSVKELQDENSRLKRRILNLEMS